MENEKESANFWIYEAYFMCISNVMEKMEDCLKPKKNTDLLWHIIDLIDEKIENNDMFDINKFILNEINNSKVMDAIYKKYIPVIMEYIELDLERTKKVCIEINKNGEYPIDVGVTRFRKSKKIVKSPFRKISPKSPKSPKKVVKCKDDEEINPYTSKCSKKCKDEEERNPKTGRCRKICKDEEERNHKGICIKKSPKVKKSKMESPKVKSPKMNLINFSKDELLRNLTITNGDDTNIIKYPIKIKLYNENVKIILVIESPTKIILYGFYKTENENRQGVVRCALYFLLEYLLKKKLITNEHICSVSSPTATDGNDERLIKIYNQIGFILYKPEIGNPINLKAPIKLLISTLEKQCMDMNYIKNADYSDYDYK